MSYQPDLFSSERLVLVCGGRPTFYRWRPGDAERLRDVLVRYGATAVMHGNALGVDREAGKVAAALGLPVTTYPAAWEDDEDAGRTRTLVMLDRKPVLVVAFPGGPGTRLAVEAARSRRIEVVDL